VANLIRTTDAVIDGLHRLAANLRPARRHRQSGRRLQDLRDVARLSRRQVEHAEDRRRTAPRTVGQYQSGCGNLSSATTRQSDHFQRLNIQSELKEIQAAADGDLDLPLSRLPSDKRETPPPR